MNELNKWLQKLNPETMLKSVERFASPSQLRIFPRFGQNPREDGMEYATFTGRTFAVTLDMLLIYLFLGPVFEFLSNLVFSPIDEQVVQIRVQQLSQGLHRGTITMAQMLQEMATLGVFNKIGVDLLIQTTLSGAAIVFFWRRYSRTPAMYLLRMSVVDATTGGKPSLRQYIVRYIAGLFAVMPLMLGFFWIIFDRRNQAMHDKIANTLVLRKPIWKKSEGFFGLLGKRNAESKAEPVEEESAEVSAESVSNDDIVKEMAAALMTEPKSAKTLPKTTARQKAAPRGKSKTLVNSIKTKETPSEGEIPKAPATKKTMARKPTSSSGTSKAKKPASLRNDSPRKKPTKKAE
jgi:uncharacterized RDD family membrane protein YckC